MGVNLKRSRSILLCCGTVFMILIGVIKSSLPPTSSSSSEDIIKINGKWYREISSFSTLEQEESHWHPKKQGMELYMYIGISIAMVLFGGLMSGLTIGLFSIDPLKLELQLRDGNQEEKRKAEALAPVLHQHHFLLCTLLLSNAAAMEALPLFLDELLPSWAAIIVSVTAVLLFGEVIPQAICTKNPMRVGYTFLWVVKFLMVILSPIAWPLSKALDCIIGDDEAHRVLFKRSELKALIDMHLKSEAGDFHLEENEGMILQGALGLKEKDAQSIMTSIDDVFMIDANAVLDHEFVKTLVRTGFSRIPVYDGRKNNIRGILMVKQLLLLDPNLTMKVRNLPLKLPLVVKPNTSLFDVLDKFHGGRSHFAVVFADSERIQKLLDDGTPIPEEDILEGVLTVEDVMEEIIQDEIRDDFDIGKMTEKVTTVLKHHQHRLSVSCHQRERIPSTASTLMRDHMVSIAGIGAASLGTGGFRPSISYDHHEIKQKNSMISEVGDKPGVASHKFSTVSDSGSEVSFQGVHKASAISESPQVRRKRRQLNLGVGEYTGKAKPLLEEKEDMEE